MTIPAELTAIIIDDENESIDLLKDILSPFAQLTIVATYTDPVEGISGILKYMPDVLFLDIQMPGKNGFDVVKEIHNQNVFPKVIFTTAFDQFAIKAIKVAAFDYLLKPVDPAELEKTIGKLGEPVQNDLSGQFKKLIKHLNNNRRLKFNTRTGFVLINSTDIIYCLADRNYSEIYLTDGRKEVVTFNLKKLYAQLPDETFFRASRSLIVNLDHLIKVERTKRKLYLKYQDKILNFVVSSGSVKDLDKFHMAIDISA